jgi:hypothetical protein
MPRNAALPTSGGEVLLRSLERVSIAGRRDLRGLGRHSHCGVLSSRFAEGIEVVSSLTEVASPSVDPIRGFGAAIVPHRNYLDSTH